MTITFQGHVHRIDIGADNKVDVHVQTAAAECGQVIVLRVPREDAAGRLVSITAYAFERPDELVAEAVELFVVQPAQAQ